MLAQQLDQFIGTTQYYKHAITGGLYTDGVQFFCEEGEAYWFLDIVFTEYNELQKSIGFLTIDLDVYANDTADILVTDGNDHELKRKHITFTDCPEGSYRFFYYNNVLMVATEY